MLEKESMLDLGSDETDAPAEALRASYFARTFSRRITILRVEAGSSYERDQAAAGWHSSGTEWPTITEHFAGRSARSASVQRGN